MPTLRSRKLQLSAVLSFGLALAACHKPRAVTDSAPEAPDAVFRQKPVNPADGLTYVWIPPGSFRMGCSPGDTECDAAEEPARQVTIAKGFWLGESEVTQAAYQKVLGKNPSRFIGHSNDANRPVEQVTWNDAKAYCQAIGGRLPTEAEWEYSARAGTTGAQYGKLDSVAWYGINPGSGPHPVKQKDPNAWGLYDMLGNVMEWVEDHYPGTEAQTRTVRGGSWSDDAHRLRSSDRAGVDPSYSDDHLGFRCAWK